ncbi:MAG: sulfate transporter/antisigma-factor antagonist [Caulobacter sp.]|nr:sulfate transporter/antisigma-factor antagonist [Caulobacter sp.]
MMVSGEMTIVQIESAYADLLAALKKKKIVKLDVSGVIESDLTFIQLIESARAYAAQNGRQLSLSAPVGAPLRQILERGGFLDDAASDRTKFWLQGASQ